MLVAWLQEAEIGAAPMTITVGREEVVDFTYSFMSFEAAAVIYRRHPREIPRIQTLEDMVENKFQFATLKGSNIFKVLKSSKKEIHQDVIKSINGSSSGLASSYDEGLRRAKWDKQYAFLMESSTANMVTRSQPCDFEMIPLGIYRRKYAMVVKNHSPLRDLLNRAIVDLQVEDAFSQLTDKWFGEDECSGCDVICGSLSKMAVLVLLSLYFMR